MDQCAAAGSRRSGSLKAGQRGQIEAVLKKAKADADLLGVRLAALHEANFTSWNEEVTNGTQEVFVSKFGPGGNGTGGGSGVKLCQEFFTDTERIRLTAEKRGHNTGASKTFRAGWNFYLKAHRDQALAQLDLEKPYLVVLAFPCSPWSSLANLLPPRYKDGVRLRQLRDRVLVEFSVEEAFRQLSKGRHFLIENP